LVCGIFLTNANGSLTFEKGKFANVAVELSQTEVRNGIGATSNQRKIPLFVWLQIIQRNAGEIGDDYKTGNLVESPGAG